MLIGVTSQSRNTEGLFRTRIWGLLEPYVRALESQGASIVILPPQAGDKLPALLHQLDGVLLPGGVDVDPAQFGEEPIPELGEVSLERDTLELFVARYTAQHGIPTLGICRGIQVMNVALGGSLYQDLPAQGFRTVQHSQKAEPRCWGMALSRPGKALSASCLRRASGSTPTTTRPLKTWRPACGRWRLRPMALWRRWCSKTIRSTWGYSGTPSCCLSNGVFSTC